MQVVLDTLTDPLCLLVLQTCPEFDPRGRREAGVQSLPPQDVEVQEPSTAIVLPSGFCEFVSNRLSTSLSLQR